MPEFVPMSVQMLRMLKNKSGLQIGAFVALSSVTFCCAVVLVILLLVRGETQRAGIATLSLSFNISDILNIPDLHLKQRGFPGPLKSLVGVATAQGASLIATATAEGAGLIETATAVGASLIADAASAASSAEMAIEVLLPKNLSLGISQFCVGFTHHTNCTNMPFNISHILPEANNNISEDVQKFVISKLQTLQYLEGITAKITSANFKGPFVSGIVLLIIVLAATLIFCLFIKHSFTNNLMKIGICLLAVLCCIPFAIPMAILSYVESNIQESGPIITIEKGDAASLSIGAFVCTIIILVLTSVILALQGKGEIYNQGSSIAS